MKITANKKNLKNYQSYLKVEEATNDFLKSRGYLKMDLPVLSPVLIPESYLEIFKTEFNYFKTRIPLFLTPSPELFLKRLLAENIGNCYYLGKCFRNSEPNSSLHLPEFTMLEYYKVNTDYLEFGNEVLELLRNIAIKLTGYDEISYNGKKVSFAEWEKYTVEEAFLKFSGIRADELLNESLFLKKAAGKGYETAGFSYEDLFSQIIAQEIEPKLGKNGRPTLLYGYPPKMASLARLSPDQSVAMRAEFYIDGMEIGGFCRELTDWKEQEKRFIEQEKKRQKAGLTAHTIDKGFIEALKYGLPDCTGAGIGFDRLAMIFADVDSINKLKLIEIKK